MKSNMKRACWPSGATERTIGGRAQNANGCAGILSTIEPELASRAASQGPTGVSAEILERWENEGGRVLTADQVPFG